MQIEAKKEYKLVLTGEEIVLIQNALIELPYKITAGLIQELPNRISDIVEADDKDGKKHAK